MSKFIFVFFIFTFSVHYAQTGAANTTMQAKNNEHASGSRMQRIHLEPSYYWYNEDEKPIWMVNMELYLRFSTFNKPNARSPLGLTWKVGAHMLINPEDNFILLPLPYFGIGPELRITDYVFVYPHVESIGFPLTLCNNVWLFTTYLAMDVGARFTLLNQKQMLIYYGLKQMSFIDDRIIFQSVSVAFQL